MLFIVFKFCYHKHCIDLQRDSAQDIRFYFLQRLRFFLEGA